MQTPQREPSLPARVHTRIGLMTHRGQTMLGENSDERTGFTHEEMHDQMQVHARPQWQVNVHSPDGYVPNKPRSASTLSRDLVPEQARSIRTLNTRARGRAALARGG
jgi:hypothetical protein